MLVSKSADAKFVMVIQLDFSKIIQWIDVGQKKK